MPLRNRLLILVAFSIVVYGSACRQNVGETTNQKTIPNKITSALRHQIDSGKALLHDGVIVLRKGNDITSEIFSLLNQTDKSFSHCGISFYEKGRWIVYHSIGGEYNPDEKMKRESFEKFVQPSDNTGFGICDLRLNAKQTLRLHTLIDSLYRRQVPFDMDFDLKTDDRLYCAEMVYKTIQSAVANDSFFTTTLHNGFRFVSTDNIFVNKQAQILCRVNYSY